MHPEKRQALKPLLVTLLRQWEQEKVLNELLPDCRATLPALHERTTTSQSTQPPFLGSVRATFLYQTIPEADLMSLSSPEFLSRSCEWIRAGEAPSR